MNGYIFNGNKLRKAREQTGHSQAGIARLIDITPQSYGEMESGQIGPSAVNLLKLSDILKLEPRDLYDRTVAVPA